MERFGVIKKYMMAQILLLVHLLSHHPINHHIFFRNIHLTKKFGNKRKKFPIAYGKILPARYLHLPTWGSPPINRQ